MTEQPKDGSDRQDAKAAWSEAGERLSGLGSRLRQHYQQHAQQPAEPTDHTDQTGAQVKDAANRLNQAVHSAFEALASASKDQSVKDDARQAGRSVADALAGTFAGISGELSRTFGDRSKSKPEPAPASASPAPASPASAETAAAEPVAAAPPDPDLPDYGSPAPSAPAGTPPGTPAPGSPESGPPATPKSDRPA